MTYIYDIALLRSVAIVAATGGAWWSDRGWRRKYLSLRRRHGLTIGRPLDFYQQTVQGVHPGGMHAKRRKSRITANARRER